MSGIYGFIRSKVFKDNIIDTKSLTNWNKLYGTIQREIKIAENILIGCSYENISKADNCPTIVIEDEKKVCAIDALLYNREELIQKCSTSENISNEELLYNFIIKYGVDSLKDVNGDFAGIVYDKESGSFTLFRDHMGVRPLYYYANDEGIFFSTDIRGLLGVEEIDIQVREKWIYEEIMGASSLSPTDTEYENVFCVVPGGYISGQALEDKVTCDIHKYWEIGRTKIKYASDEQYKDELRRLITDSIRRRADAVKVKLGAELSGGLDSGVIDIILNRLGKEVTYFSWSYDPSELEYSEGDERLIVRDICKQEGISCNFRHRGTGLGEDSNITKNMKSIGYIFDGEPDIWTYAFPPFINTDDICHTSDFLHKQGVGVVFTGHAGDEGVSHRSNPYEMYYNGEYYHFYKYMYAKVDKNKKLRRLRALKKSYKYSREYKEKFSQPFKHVYNVPSIMSKQLASKYKNEKLQNLKFAFDPVSYVRQGGSRNRLDVVAVFGAFNGVRYLIPYVDYRVIDYAVSIPRYLYMSPKGNRYIYREAFKDIMPESLYKQNCKRSNSLNGIEPNPNWKEPFVEEKKLHASKLDRNKWGKYLDFDKIDHWANCEEPTDENYNEQFGIMYKLGLFIMAESAIKYARNFEDTSK